jgi:hypothetical protein
MDFEPLGIDYDDHGEWVTLSRGADSLAGTFLPRAGFKLKDLIAALLATGWVRERAGTLVVDRSVNCQRLADFVEEMLDYFDGPGRPTSRLLDVERTVAARLGDALPGTVPLEAFAWLDLVVREEVADVARSVADVWSNAVLTIRVAEIRDRRLRELVARYASSPQVSGLKMAPSSRTMRADDAAKTA